MKAIRFGYLYALVPIIYLWVLDVGLNNKHAETNPYLSLASVSYEDIPMAIPDTFYLGVGCENVVLTGNILSNDIFDGIEQVSICRITAPQIGIFSCGPGGNFIFKTDPDFRGSIDFTYRLCDNSKPWNYTESTLTIVVDDDLDCDKIANIVDLDDDNDGILDIHEGDGAVDTDQDGIPNSLDIDSDNDGITDFIEWQREGSEIQLLLSDINQDGWEDAFDAATGGEYYEPVDTDLDGIPDFLDSDSDADGVEDFIEGFDLDNNGIPDLISLNLDDDLDGLDNAFDTIPDWSTGLNSVGSNAPLPDLNKDGIRDWRDQSNHPLKQVNEQLAREQKKLIISPNPTKTFCTVTVPVEISGTVDFKFYLLDLKGQLLLQDDIDKTTFKLQLEGLTAGTFVLLVDTPEGRFYGKVVKNN